MTRLVLVRHGRAASGWDAGGDPGLDEVGAAQAEAMAEALAAGGPLPVVVSPLCRTRETAAALERRWALTARVEPAVGEIPTPDEVEDRGAWLGGVLRGRWADQDDGLRAWRDTVVEALLGCREDTVVVTHFVAINVAVGAATGDDRVTVFTPDNCSRTILEVGDDDAGLSVVELGAQVSRTVVQ